MAGGRLDRHYADLDYNSPSGIRAQDIPYDAEKDIKTKIDEITSGTGINEAQHEGLDSLTHNLVESCFTEIIRTEGRVTSIIVWSNAGKTTKVRETNYVYTNGRVTQTILKQYDGMGTLKVTRTTDLVRTNGQLTEETSTVVYA